MNISTQVCGLFITVLLIHFYYKQPTLGLKTEISFRHLLYVVFACVCLDILSCITISKALDPTALYVITIAKLYIMSLSSVAYFALFYTVTDVYETINKSPRLHKLALKIMYVATALAIFYFPIYIHYDGTELYSYGPACLVTYASVGLYIVCILFEIVSHKKYIKLNRRRALLAWMFLWISAAIYQFINPQVLIVGFASCAGVLIIFFEMENPEASISRRTGHFSSAVTREYIDYLYRNRKRFSLLMISFTTIADSSNDTLMLEKSIAALSKFLFTVKNCKIFDTAEGYFLLVFENSDFIESTKFQIKNFFQNIEDQDDIEAAISLLNPFYITVPDSSIASTTDEMMNIITGFIPTEHKHFDGDEVVVTNAVINDFRKKRQIEDIVVEAIEADRVEVFFQPIFCVAKERFTSAEALVRIRLADSTLLTPDAFISIVEETGRIIHLSDAIYKKTLSFINLFHLERLGIECIDLNLSMRQAESPIFASRFADMVKEYKVDPQMVNLEITETFSMRSKENTLTNMNKLRDLGIKFSLDDFGSGSSNLNYMIDMPVDIVKLDKTLTQAYDTSPKAKAIITAIIEMAHSVDIAIIAEGIETKEAFDTMVNLGIDYIQGYYFSPALAERDFLSFIQQNNLKQ